MRPALVVLAVVILGCSDGGGARGRSSSSARLLEIEGPAHHEVGLTLVLKGRPGKTLDVRLEVSEDGGRTFRPAAVSPAGPYRITSRPEKVEITWDAQADLGTGVFDLRLRPRDAPEGRPGQERRVMVANYGYAEAAELSDWALRGEDPTELVLADAWSFENWASGHLEGAISLTYDRINEEGAAALPYPKDLRLVFYCGGGT